ncbi:MAG: LON peptidase substrate-binding domain-containing protein [Planctomycetota bacterium]
MDDTVTIDFNKPLPLFPLQRCVLLPHAAVPLHIFEDRYRAMTRDALDSHGLIAMAVYDPEPDELEEIGPQEDAPPLLPAVCVGYISRHDRLDDGRYQLILQGLTRATIREEVQPDDGGYRKAMLEPRVDSEAHEIDFERPRAVLDGLLADPLLNSLASVKATEAWREHAMPTAMLVDLASLMVLQDDQERYAMLADDDPLARTQRLIFQLQGLKKTLEIANKFGRGQSDEGLPLN